MIRYLGRSLIVGLLLGAGGTPTFPQENPIVSTESVVETLRRCLRGRSELEVIEAYVLQLATIDVTSCDEVEYAIHTMTSRYVVQLLRVAAADQARDGACEKLLDVYRHLNQKRTEIVKSTSIPGRCEPRYRHCRVSTKESNLRLRKVPHVSQSDANRLAAIARGQQLFEKLRFRGWSFVDGFTTSNDKRLGWVHGDFLECGRASLR